MSVSSSWRVGNYFFLKKPFDEMTKKSQRNTPMSYNVLLKRKTAGGSVYCHCHCHFLPHGQVMGTSSFWQFRNYF